jgi:hypothetical protein
VPSRLSCWGTGRNSTTTAPQESSSDAFPSPKARSSYKRYTRGLAAITQLLEPLLETPSDKVSTGRRRWPTPLELSAPAKGVSSTQGRPTCPLRPCRRYPSPGLLLCGVWTSSAPCRRHPGLHAPLGRVVRHRQSSEARNEQDGRQSGRGLHQHSEHPTATSLLPLRCFQVVRIPRSHAKFGHQGRVSLASAKPDPPSGAKRGEPPLHQKFQSKRLPRSPGYVGSRTPRSKRGCM